MLAMRVADRVQTTIGDGRFPLVLGGDCSIVLGRCSLYVVVAATDSPISIATPTSGTPTTSRPARLRRSTSLSRLGADQPF